MSPNRNPRPMWLLWLLVGLSATHSDAKDVLTVPQQMSLSTDTVTQQLSVSWLGGAAMTFDLMILRTELNETVFYDTASVTADPVSGRCQWNWTSVEPLECTSLSVQLRSRDGQKTSGWSDTQILPGMDLPSNERSQMYPQDRVVVVGTNTTFCCIVGEGLNFGNLRYKRTVMNVTRISRRTYAITSGGQAASASSGTNVFCCDQQNRILGGGGAVVFVGYPPLPSALVCETSDLVSAVCQWNRGRDTHLLGKKRRTYYTLNGRNCTEANEDQKVTSCGLEQWDGNWTLVARNPLGQYSLTDAADLRHRVRPVSPANLTVADVHAWNTTLKWDWRHESYRALPLVCQVEVTSNWHSTTRTFPGVGLRSVVLLDQRPDEDYSARVRCGAQQNFYKWGDWSGPLPFKSSTYRPEAPDVWVWMDRDNTGRVVWKPLTRRESHGQITGYEVTLWSAEENQQRTESLAQSTYSLPINLTSSSGTVLATVTAKNGAGVSPPASVVVPLRVADAELSASRTFYTQGGFPLSWQSHANASRGYVLQWHNASCLQDCPVDWIKMAAENTSVSLQSDHFLPGVRYTLSLYSCSSESSELLHSWQGYMQELAPSGSVPHLLTNQKGSDVQLTWGEIPLVNRRGFILGYRVYLNNASQLKLIANVSDASSTSCLVKGLSLGSYKFTVKAFTSAGEDTGSTASISLEPYTDWLILEILASLGTMACVLVLVTFICYKKRNWVKKAFYPDIPEPKLAGDWSRTQGPLDVKPSPHSVVHIVDEPQWGSSKEALVAVPEEEGGTGDEPADGDEPASLRYYNQVMDERPIRPRYPEDSSGSSSASSLDSARTDVTYTGIQTSGSSLALQPQPDPPAGSRGGGGGGYRPQMQPGAPGQGQGPAEEPQSFPEPQPAAGGGSFGGYQPQSSWHLDSPVEDGGSAPCLGSPTSIASTQFLLPDPGDDEAGQGSSATTWFQSLLSSGKP